MKRIFISTNSPALTGLALLILRIGFGGLMIPHGYDKLIHFADYKDTFISFIGMSMPLSLGLNIFAEFFCAILVVMGLFTRLATIPLIISMLVALFMSQNGDITGKGQEATLFLLAFVTLTMTGGGKYSLDEAFFKHLFNKGH